MLQQTQVRRVVPRYRRWLRRWPTVRRLARASRAAVLREWSGLGYNRRAISLQRAAQTIIRDHGGRVPRDLAALERLPGVGHYTARAIAAFAFGSAEPFVDTNVRRTLGRLEHGWHHPTVRADARLLRTDGKLLPPRRAAAWHQALMDLGAIVCLPRPNCGVCPLQRHCRAYPAILERPRRRSRLNRERFATSDRFWRGALLRFALSRRRPWSPKQAQAAYPALGFERTASLLDAMVRDGLLERRGARYSLPR